MSRIPKKIDADSRRMIVNCLGLAALVAAFAAGGCDELPTMDPAGTGHGLLGEDVAVNDDPSDDASESEVVGEVYTEAAVGVVLEGMQGGEVMGKALKWTVYNALDEDILAVPTLRCEGLAVLTRNLELAALELGPKRSAEIELSAADMPIQSALGAGTVQLDLAVSTAKNPERSVRVLSPMWYYRHSEGYHEIDVFTEEVLMEKHGGAIFDIPVGIQATNGVVGRVLDGGQVHEVNALGPELTMGDAESGQYRATGIGLDLGEDEDDVELGMAVENGPSPLNGTVNVRWCISWSSINFTDGLGAYAAFAQYTRAQLWDQSVSPEERVWDGWLDTNGCAWISTKSNNNYRFRLGSAVRREQGGATRHIYAQPSDASCGLSWVGHNSYLSTGWLIDGETLTLSRSANTAQARIAVVAIRPMMYPATRQWPSSMTYIRPRTNTIPYCSQDTNTSCWAPWEDGCGGNGRIHISTSFPNPDTGQGTIDHSTYRFIIGHEMGHRQAWATDGPQCMWQDQWGNTVDCNRDIKWQTTSPHYCNCELFYSYKTGCQQSRGWTGVRQREAWANFYSAALFSDRDQSGCNWWYWRAMYKMFLGNPIWWSPGPVQWNCGQNETWMENYCFSAPGNDEAYKGAVHDWMAFFWNLWTDGPNRADIAEMTEIWSNTDMKKTHDSVRAGYRWSHSDPNESTLLKSAGNKWGVGSAKYNNFDTKGLNAGVAY
jgi:hypothetical protein